MGRPAGRRTVGVRTYLSPAEASLWEALRASEAMPKSRADHLMDILVPLAEQKSDQDNGVRQALEVWAREERGAIGFQERGGRPPKVRR